jgi:allantoinase
MPEREPISWPGGARIALWVVPNIEHYAIDRPSTSIYPATSTLAPDVLNYSWRDYGPRIGIWRLMEVLDRHGIRGTVALNSDVCKVNPQIVEEGMKRDWEFMGHGINNSNLMAGLEEDAERQVIETVLGTIEQATGQRPRGWLSPALTETFNTPDLLAEAGVRYVSDWVNDDQPYPMRVRSGTLVSMPYSIEVNDIPVFLAQGQSGPEFERLLRDQFDVLYQEAANTGKVMSICLHPFLIGLPFRSLYLDRALDHIVSHDEVWLATGGEIADYYIEEYLEGDHQHIQG